MSPVALAKARESVPNATFICEDLLEWTPRQKFGVVSVLYVFVHFVEERNWRHFLLNALSAVDENGFFIFADNFSESVQKPVAHVVSRPLSCYEEELAFQGFELDQKLRLEFLESSTGGARKQFYFARRVR